MEDPHLAHGLSVRHPESSVFAFLPQTSLLPREWCCIAKIFCNPPARWCSMRDWAYGKSSPSPAHSVACPEGVATGPHSAAFGLLQNWLGGDPGSLQPTLCQRSITALGALSLPPNIKDDSGFSPLLTGPKEMLCPSAALTWCSPAEHHLPRSSPGCTQVMPLQRALSWSHPRSSAGELC